MIDADNKIVGEVKAKSYSDAFLETERKYGEKIATESRLEQRQETRPHETIVMEPEAWVVEKPGKRTVVDAKKYNASKPKFWLDGKMPEGYSVTPLYPGKKITEVT